MKVEIKEASNSAQCLMFDDVIIRGLYQKMFLEVVSHGGEGVFRNYCT